MADVSSVRKIAVIGSGIMGSGITPAALLADFEQIVLCDVDSFALQKSKESIELAITSLEAAIAFVLGATARALYLLPYFFKIANTGHD